jgi:hypothetical protein
MTRLTTCSVVIARPAEVADLKGYLEAWRSAIASHGGARTPIATLPDAVILLQPGVRIGEVSTQREPQQNRPHHPTSALVGCRRNGHWRSSMRRRAACSSSAA